MKQLLLFAAFIFFFSSAIQAQKKLQPVSQSAMTGISLPAGSKKDGRLLSVMAGRILLELESKKAGTPIGELELLVLPPVAQTGFTADSLVAQLANTGWNIAAVLEDDKYVWLQKENQYLMAYFSMDGKETALYFGKPETPPIL